MTERSRRITTFIFLLSIFVFLTVLIFVWSYKYYQTGRIQSTNLSKSAIECGVYAFRVVENTINYENKTLRFKIEYIGKGSDKFSRLSVFTGKNITLSEEITTFIRSPTVVIKDIEIENEFSISPQGCEAHMVKRCDLNAKKCTTE